jgi:hypothetical protein
LVGAIFNEFDFYYYVKVTCQSKDGTAETTTQNYITMSDIGDSSGIYIYAKKKIGDNTTVSPFWYPAKPYIYLDNEWKEVKATYIYNSKDKEWKQCN